MIAILQLLVISTISAAFVRRVFARWEPAFAGVGERLVFEYAAGLGVLGLLVFVLGVAQLFYAWAFILLLVVMAAVSWRALSEVVREVRGGLRLRKSDVGGYVVTGLVAVIGVLTLIRSLAPPVGDDWDSLAYHLAIPKLYLAHGGIYYVPFSSHSNFPFTWEMLYTLGLGFGSISLAKLFHFGAWVLVLGAIHSLSSRYFSRATAGVAVLAFAAVPIAAWEATTAYIDVATALYTVLVVYALLNFSSTQDRRWAIAAGMMAGLAAGTKLTALAMIGVVFVWILWPAKEGKLQGRLTLALGAVVLAAILAAPWYIKSLIYTGNPVYPFFYGLFGGRNWSSLAAELYRADQLKFGVGHGIINFLRLPLDLTTQFARFSDFGARTTEDISRYGLQTLNPQILSTWVGPATSLMFLLVPFALVKRGVQRPMIAVAVAIVVMWFIAMQNSRYLIPALALLIPAAAWAAECFGIRRIVLGFVAVLSILSVYIMWSYAAPALPVALGTQSQADYLRGFDLYRTSEFINRELPKDAKVAFFGDTRGFYIDRDYLWADSGHNAIVPDGDQSSRIAWLAGHGYQYILINHSLFALDPKAQSGLELVYLDPNERMAVWEVGVRD